MGSSIFLLYKLNLKFVYKRSQNIIFHLIWAEVSKYSAAEEHWGQLIVFVLLLLISSAALPERDALNLLC